jgi:cephalosporin hydroxylase
MMSIVECLLMSRIINKIKKTIQVSRVYLRSENSWFITAFWRHFYKRHKRTHDNTFWLGVNAVKPPTDLWVYQEIMYERKPDVIIETGTKYGGTTNFLATICDLMNHGRIISVDIRELDNRPRHPRITYITGSSLADETIGKIKSMVKPGEKVMVILDSDHHYEFVKQEMPLYEQFVTSGQYLIVEDTCVNGNPTYENYGPGPMEAVLEFLGKHPAYKSDRTREKFWVTYNPKGYLLKS